MSLSNAYAMKRKKMAHGGSPEKHMKGVHHPIRAAEDDDPPEIKQLFHDKVGRSPAGSANNLGMKTRAKEEHERVLGEMRSMPKPNLYAEGGKVDGDEMLDGIMRKRCYAEGGKVEEDHETAEPIADFEANDFDLMHQEDVPDVHDTGANSGDEIGDKALEDEEHDELDEIMRSRKMKGRMPVPA